MKSYLTNFGQLITEDDADRKGNLLNRTKHSIKRCQQRRISEAELHLIMLWGSRIRRPGGVWEYFIGKKEGDKIIQELKYQIQELDKLIGKAILVDENSSMIVTAYHKNNLI